MTGPNRRRAAAYNLVFNYASVAFAVINGVVLVPVYLRYFDLATYGAWLASGNIVGLLSILDGGINLVFAQRLAVSFGEQNMSRYSDVAGSGALLSFTLAGLVGMIGVGIAPFVPTWINVGSSQQSVLSLGFTLAALGSAFTLGYLTFGAIVQSWQRTLFAGITNVLTLLVGTLGTIVGLWEGLGVVAIGFGVLLRGLVGILLLGGYVIIMWRRIGLPKPKIKTPVLMDLVRTTIPVMLGRTGSIILGNSRTTLVAILIDPTTAALVVLTGRVYDVCGMFLNPIGSSTFAGMAHIFGSTQRQRSRAIVQEVIGLFSALSAVLFGLALAMNESFINLWVGSKSFGGASLSVTLCISVLLSTRLNLVGMILTALGEIGKTAWSSLFELALRLLLIYWLVQKIGVLGISLAEICSILLVSAWYFYKLLIKKLDLRQHEGNRLITTGVLPVVASLLIGFFWQGQVSPSHTWLIFVLQGLVIGFVMIITVYVLSPASRVAAKSFIDSGKVGIFRNHRDTPKI